MIAPSPKRAGAPSIPLADRFWSKADRSNPDGCWLWTSNRHHNGYGQIAASRNGATRQRWLWAHRVAWELTHGLPVPDGMLICHRCDTPLCVNPAHLFLGSQADNIRDAVRKGRLMQSRDRAATGQFIPVDRVLRQEALKLVAPAAQRQARALDTDHQPVHVDRRRSA